MDRKEEYYIKFYNSLVPNGYNVEEKIDGGRNYFLNYSKDDFNDIVFDIKFSVLSFDEIADKYNIDKSMFHLKSYDNHHDLYNKPYFYLYYIYSNIH